MGQENLSSFSKYLALSDTVQKERSALTSDHQLHVDRTRRSSEVNMSTFAFLSVKRRTSQGSVHVPKFGGGSSISHETFENKNTLSGSELTKRQRAPWGRSASSEVNIPSIVDIPACSENLMNYKNRRNSDALLSGYHLSKLKKVPVNRKQSLPTGRSSEIAHIFDSVTRNNPLTDLEQTENVKENGSRGDHTTSNSELNRTTPDMSVGKHSSADLLSQECMTREKRLQKMYSSAPDISIQHHKQTEGRNSLLQQPGKEIWRKVKSETGSDKSGSATSRIFSIFRNLVPGVSRDQKEEVSSRSLTFPRRHSMDSHLSLIKPPRHKSNSMKTSKRVIKIIRPDHSHAMYISGADTLGGLPEVEDNPHESVLASSKFIDNDEDGIDDYFNIGRRSSCPVIFEGEESDDCASSRKSCFQSSTDIIDLDDESRPTDDSSDSNLEDNSSEEDDGCRQKSAYSDRSAYVTAGRHTIGSSDQVDSLDSPSMLQGIVFIVDKGRKQQKYDASDGDKYSGVTTRAPLSSKMRTRQCVASTRDRQTSTHMLKKKISPSQAVLHDSSESRPDKSIPGHSPVSFSKKVKLKVNVDLLDDSSESLSSVENEAESSNYFSDISSVAN